MSEASSDQIRIEFHAVILRYMDESDLQIYQVIGALEAVKMDLWDMLEKHRKKNSEE